MVSASKFEVTADADFGLQGPDTTTTKTVAESITETAGPTSTALSHTNSTASDNFPAGPYTVTASRSGSPFDQLSLTAGGNNFTLGGAPAIYVSLIPAAHSR
jgi:hypothetical protein